MGQGLNRLVFQPPTPSYGNDANLLWLQTKRREMVPAFHVFRSAMRQTILFSHGNAEDLGMIVNYFREICEAWDVNVFAYEYTGYGMSSGVPSELNVYADIEAAYEYLTKKFKIPWQKIILYGRSLGTGASVHLASNFPIRGMILQSGLLSIHRIGLNLRLTLPGDMFCNIDKISKVQCPVFVIHGVKDEIVPFSHGMQLYNSCPTAVTPYWLEDAGHNNVELTGQIEFIENISRFLKFLDVNPPGIPPERLPRFDLYKDHAKFLRHFLGTSSSHHHQASIDRRDRSKIRPRCRVSINDMKVPNAPKHSEQRWSSVKDSSRRENRSPGSRGKPPPLGILQRHNKVVIKRQLSNQKSRSSSIATKVLEIGGKCQSSSLGHFSHMSQPRMSQFHLHVGSQPAAISTKPFILSCTTPRKMVANNRRRSFSQKSCRRRFHDCCGGEDPKHGPFTASENDNDESILPSVSNQTVIEETKNKVCHRHLKLIKRNRRNNSEIPQAHRSLRRNWENERRDQSQRNQLNIDNGIRHQSSFQSLDEYQQVHSSRRRLRIAIPISQLDESRKERHRQIKARSRQANVTANIPIHRSSLPVSLSHPLSPTLRIADLRARNRSIQNNVVSFDQEECNSK